MEPSLPNQAQNRAELKVLNAKIAIAKHELHKLVEMAERIRARIKTAARRARGGKVNDEARMKRLNEKSKVTATFRYARWCDVDDAFLWENKSKMKYMELAKELGRTRKAIKARIYILKQSV